MRWAPLVLSFALAGLLAPALLALLERAGVVRQNYRGRLVPAASGVLIVVAGLFTLAPLAALDELADSDSLSPGLDRVLAYGLGVAALGLMDDLLGGRAPAGEPAGPAAPRGMRGHARAAAAGSLSSGALKAAGTLGLALYVISGSGRSAGEYLLAVALLVLSTNLFNLLDLRPGRAAKVFLVLGLALTIATWDVLPLQTLGLFVGPTLVLLAFDLRERAMLGDVGSNLLGALAGIWLVLSLSTEAELGALVVLAALTLYGELRSISALVERNPLLRRLDSLGRDHH
jgi:UDP-GlcNAc:undecaprenyl-phosphate GlcNAc-1-phosphate transferase